MKYKALITGGGLVGIIALTSCSSTQFGGETGKTSSSSMLNGANQGEGMGSSSDESPGAGSKANAKTTSGSLGTDGSTGTDPNGVDGNGKGGLGGDGSSQNGESPGQTDSSNGGGGLPGSGLNAECLSKKASEYNIAIVIDASGSQLQTDPNFLREKASLNFAIEMARFARIHPTISIELGIVGFSDTSIVGTNGPQDVGKNGTDKLSADITQVARNPKGNTNFEAGLRVGETALGLMGAKKGVTTQRNFLVFLTDGDPNRSDTVTTSQANDNPLLITQAINTKVQGIVNNYDAAMITVASGAQIQQKGIDVVQGMALPKVGTISPEHVGKYIRADTDKALEELSKLLGAIVSDCKK